MFTWFSHPTVHLSASCSLLQPTVQLFCQLFPFSCQLFTFNARCSLLQPTVQCSPFLPAVPFNSQLLTLFIQIFSLFWLLSPYSSDVLLVLAAVTLFCQLSSFLPALPGSAN
jgi:hypothetical protein